MLAGLKVHLIIYGLLASSLVAASFTTKHYYTKTIVLNQALNLAKAEAEFHRKDAQNLKDTAELDKLKTEELKKDAEKALAELEQVRKNPNVKVFLDIVVPSELNNFLRKRHSVQNNKAKNTGGIRKANTISRVQRLHSKRPNYVSRKVQASATGLQQG